MPAFTCFPQIPVDDKPTEGSNHLVYSKDVYDLVKKAEQLESSLREATQQLAQAKSDLAAAQQSISTLTNNLASSLVITKTISTFPTESVGYVFNTGESTLSLNGVTIENYSKGIFITTGTDGFIIVVGPSGGLYTAFRFNKTWKNLKKY